jgi:proline dehydrogenase
MVETAPVRFDDLQKAFVSRSNADLRRMHLLFGTMAYPWLVKMGTVMINLSLKIGLPVKGLIKSTLFAHFCGGESIEECSQTINKLHRFQVGTILDYSVEGAKTDAGFEKTAQEIIQTIKKSAEQPEAIPFSVFKVSGIASLDLLEKIQSGKALSQDEKEAYRQVNERVDRICGYAASLGVRIFIDAEESWIQQPIDQMAYAMMAKYNNSKPIVYNTYQLYRSDALDNLRRAYHYATMNNYWLGAKLVRGAYMEKERKRAEEMGYPSPIQVDKAATDRDFDQALRFCVDNKQRIAFCAGTHNEQSSQYLTLLMNKYNISPGDPNVYFAQLYGMSDHISYNLAEAGYRVAKYVPYGPVKAVMPYLFRRAEENTSVAGQTGRELGLIKAELNRRSRNS